MKQLPKAIDRNGDLWVPCATKQLVFRALQDAQLALESTHGLPAAGPGGAVTVDHSQQLHSLALVAQLLGMDRSGPTLPAVHEQLGEPTPHQARLLRNLATLRAA
jgi:hypothetical protein